MENPANVELLIENLVQAAAEYENNCDRLVAKTIRVQLEKAKQAIRDALVPTPAQTVSMREALERIAAIENKDFGPDWEEIEEAREIARTALASQPPAAPVPVMRDLTPEERSLVEKSILDGSAVLYPLEPVQSCSAGNGGEE